MTTTTTTTRAQRNKQSFFDLWREDRSAILATMVRNLAADLAAGYDAGGASVTRQCAEMADYAAATAETMRALYAMTPQERAVACADLLYDAGVIS